MNAQALALICLVLVGAAALAVGCAAEPDGSLPPEVTFRGEAVHTGADPDELIVRYYPNSTEPSDYTVTFEIRKRGTTEEAVAGRVYTNISAERPIELPAAGAEPGVPVTVSIAIYDRWGRTVHTSTTTLTPGEG
jgi:hypothetical protein